MHSRANRSSKRSSVARTTHKSRSSPSVRVQSQSLSSISNVSSIRSRFDTPSRSLSDVSRTITSSSSSVRSRTSSAVVGRRNFSSSNTSESTLPSFESLSRPVSLSAFKASKPTLVGDRPRQKLNELVDRKDPESYVIRTAQIVTDFSQVPKPPAVNPHDNISLSNLGECGTPVTIYKMCKNAMENEKNRYYPWLIRSEGTLMGYTNQLTGADHMGDEDYLPVFKSRNDAVEYCTRHNIPFHVIEDPVIIAETRSYADNFKWKGPPPVDH